MTNVTKTNIAHRITKVNLSRKTVNSKIKGVDLDTSRFIWHEVPTINGARTILTIAHSYVTGLIEIFRDGLLLKKTTDYAETNSTTITLVSALATEENVWVNYIKQ